MDSADDSGRATTSSETSSLHEYLLDDDPGAFSPYRSKLTSHQSSQSLFEGGDFQTMSSRLEQIKKEFFADTSSELSAFQK